MRLGTAHRLLLCTAALVASAAVGAGAHDRQKFLKLVERQTQIANLLAQGKLAYDAGDFATSAARWNALLRLDGVPDDVLAQVKPLLAEARAKAKDTDLTLPVQEDPRAEPRVSVRPEAAASSFAVQGTVSGGGAAGPGGAVVMLRRTDGPTPRPAPLDKPLLQKGKQFIPHVLAVPVGSRVDFKNEDEIFHNVFSLSPAAKFDTGLHKGGEITPVKFEKPGVVEVFCNIHAAMLGFLVVVDTPWYAVADGSGSFQIRNVPAGSYDIEVWHEAASQPTKKHLALSDGSGKLALVVAGDRRANSFPPDKYGKPRQQQLGY